MKKINDIKIGARLNIILSLTIAVIVIALGLYMINSQKTKIIEDTDTRMYEQVEDLARVIEMQIHQNQKSVDKALEVALHSIRVNGGFKVTNEDWLIGNENITEKYTYIDELASITGSVVSIFEKNQDGFTRISTSLINNGVRVIGTKVPFSSPVGQTIINGGRFQ